MTWAIVATNLFSFVFFYFLFLLFPKNWLFEFYFVTIKWCSWQCCSTSAVSGSLTGVRLCFSFAFNYYYFLPLATLKNPSRAIFVFPSRGINNPVALMAVVGPSRHSRVSMSVSMSLMQGAGGAATATGASQAVLAAAVAQPPPPYYHPAAATAPPPPPPQQDPVQPDRPIGYGAFGVVWWVHYFLSIFSLESNWLNVYLSMEFVEGLNSDRIYISVASISFALNEKMWEGKKYKVPQRHISMGIYRYTEYGWMNCGKKRTKRAYVHRV